MLSIKLLLLSKKDCTFAGINIALKQIKYNSVLMEMQERVKAINNVLRDYFANKTNPRQVPAFKLMGLFIDKGIFKKDHRNGLPIRNVLRKLNNEGRLHDIPYARGELKQKNTNWTFVDVNADMDANTLLSKGLVDVSNGTSVRKKGSSRIDSDEYYVIGLCNEVLKRKASQQHCFEFLLGDTGRKLPVDAYYEDLNLVIEYYESQHTESTPFFDNKKTVSGVPRGEQRRLYDERRRTELPKHGIKVIILRYSDFGTTKRLKRDNREHDIEVVRKKLAAFVSSLLVP